MYLAAISSLDGYYCSPVSKLPSGYPFGNALDEESILTTGNMALNDASRMTGMTFLPDVFGCLISL